ncbi:MAG TPA: hypothetical protein VMF06_20930 [Candidatus Limnocylindria bacterium]|nr:hypothetical protein [Candidatus Limnocylindria bacterium]
MKTSIMICVILAFGSASCKPIPVYTANAGEVWRKVTNNISEVSLMDWADAEVFAKKTFGTVSNTPRFSVQSDARLSWSAGTDLEHRQHLIMAYSYGPEVIMIVLAEQTNRPALKAKLTHIHGRIWFADALL